MDYLKKDIYLVITLRGRRFLGMTSHDTAQEAVKAYRVSCNRSERKVIAKVSPVERNIIRMIIGMDKKMGRQRFHFAIRPSEVYIGTRGIYKANRNGLIAVRRLFNKPYSFNIHRTKVYMAHKDKKSRVGLPPKI